MKVIHDEDLSILHAYTQSRAKALSKDVAEKIIQNITHQFNNDTKFGDLTYAGAMTYINTIGVDLLLRLFDFSCYVGKQFPDADHSSRDLFEELIAGMRVLANVPEINKNEHVGGIK